MTSRHKHAARRVERLPQAMAPWREAVHLAWLRDRIEARLAELAAQAPPEPGTTIVLPKSGLRLRCVAPGAYLFAGVPQHG